MRQTYLALLLLAMLAAGCGLLNPPAATPVPFQRWTATDVFNTFARAGLQMQNPEKNMSVTGRNAPSQFSDRYTFEIPRIAPAGGQVVVFSSPDQLQTWQKYIDTLRNNSSTRRDVIFVYYKDNIFLQLDAELTNAEAAAYRDALNTLG